MKVLRDRIAREERTIGAMMYIYCRDHHALDGALCAQCGRLLVYARRRLATCPFQDAKPACNRCQVHCYSETMRERVKAVMRYAGPRMLLRHPILSLFHLLDTRREAPISKPRRRNAESR
jgi:predicted amidophosphoribosyltransferase